MEKKLLLLGILRGHDMHGYQMNEMLMQDAGIGITLKKANAYKLLNQMADDGWITYREEREGNRPPRRVYAIAPVGEAAFQRLLRESLVAYAAPQMPSVIAYNYLDELPADEAVALLQERRLIASKRFDQQEEIPKEMLQAHLGMIYLHRFYTAELEWLDEIINHLNEKQTT
jgi:DNA-binding PadR family transcriptional regulator